MSFYLLNIRLRDISLHEIISLIKEDFYLLLMKESNLFSKFGLPS